MKTIIRNSIAALFAISFASSASAATIVSYSNSSGNFAPINPASNLQTTTSFNPAVGGGLSQTGRRLTGWAPAIDLQKYAGFRISAQPGFELLVDVFNHNTGGSTDAASGLAVNSFQWGYRIDLNNDGSFGAVGEGWVFDRLYVPADPGFEDQATTKQWDVDIRTTGTVEFGLFASAPLSTGRVSSYSSEVVGSVNAVPEPSALLLSSLGALALLRRRRK